MTMGLAGLLRKDSARCRLGSVDAGEHPISRVLKCLASGVMPPGSAQARGACSAAQSSYGSLATCIRCG